MEQQPASALEITIALVAITRLFFGLLMKLVTVELNADTWERDTELSLRGCADVWIGAIWHHAEIESILPSTTINWRLPFENEMKLRRVPIEMGDLRDGLPPDLKPRFELALTGCRVIEPWDAWRIGKCREHIEVSGGFGLQMFLGSLE
jgi:hypothetical protein